MANIRYDKLCRSEFYHNLCAKTGLQDIILNQLELKVNDFHKKDEKITTNFEHSNAEDVGCCKQSSSRCKFIQKGGP